MSRISVPSCSIIGGKTLTRPEILAHAPTKKGSRLWRTGAVSADALRKILDEKLQQLHQEISEFKTGIPTLDPTNVSVRL